MESRITFLGTGTGGAVTQHHRNAGGIVIESDNFQFVLDPGPGALTAAREYGINLRKTTAIIVSNSNIYNSNDANVVMSVMTHDGLDPKGILIANNTFVHGADTINSGLTKNHASYVERVITPSFGQKIGIGNIEVHALKAENEDPSSLGFKFFTKDFVLTYTGNTGYTKEITDQYDQSDILIINMPFLEKKSNYGFNKEDVIKLLKKVQPRLAVLTSIGLKVINYDPIQVGREIRQETGIQTVVARDGASLTPTSYSAGLRQQRLNLYD